MDWAGIPLVLVPRGRFLPGVSLLVGVAPTDEDDEEEKLNMVPVVGRGGVATDLE